ncbi:uncharacterized protein LOC116690906 [Etheostoma spectabile]|uniref:uncharacterized protein LOC116690906 n=1 Tax=Etheostoma spectabile TaxID=54343 RepID=UPI0013AEABCE|nr:uncharacterized protein LOC116690906 [Etheostoma spectabile]
MKTTCLEKDNATEADERWECIELLKAMLKWTEKERITPSGILNHPFITMSYLNSSWSEEAETSPSQASVPSASPAAKPGIDTEEAAEPHTNQATQLSTNQASDPSTRQAQTRTKDTIMRTCVDDNTRRTHRLTSTALPSGFVRVQPAPSQSRIPPEETSEEESISKSYTLASTFEDPNTSNLSDNTDDSESKKRKENRLKCFSWMRRTFCSCCYVDNIQK